MAARKKTTDSAEVSEVLTDEATNTDCRCEREASALNICANTRIVKPIVRVKKEMRVFQSLVGPDLDADGLLAPARQLATKRVVVKRPDYAPPLADVATPNAVVTKGHRFDIYAGTAVEPQG